MTPMEMLNDIQLHPEEYRRDEYEDHEDPTEIAIENARKLIARTEPIMVRTTAANGISVWHRFGEYYKLIECYNDGEMYVLENYKEEGLRNYEISVSV